MELTFDKGTVVLRGIGRREFENLQLRAGLMTWDDRTECARATAMQSAEIKTELMKRQKEIPEPFPHLQKIRTFNADLPPLRGYQSEALAAWHRVGQRGIICLPTGAGKTLTALAAVAQVKRSALILVPTRILLHQWAKAAAKHLNIKIGILGDGNFELCEVTIATYESAWRSIHRIGKFFDFIIADEVHHFGSGERDEILLCSLASKRLGLTATPPDQEPHMTKLRNLMGCVVFSLKIGDLVGIALSEFQYFQVRMRLTPEEQIKYDALRKIWKNYRDAQNTGNKGTDFGRLKAQAQKTSAGKRALNCLAESQKISGLCQEKLQNLRALCQEHSNKQILIFTPDTAAAYFFSSLFRCPAITSEIKKDERDYYMGQFANSAVKILVSCKVLNEGFDLPAAQVAIIVGGCTSNREFTQRVGRVLRKKPGKIAMIYELIVQNTYEQYRAKKR